MENYIQPGETVTVNAPYDVMSGGGVLVGTLFGIACGWALAGGLVNIKTTGVFSLPKEPAQAWTVGALIYWDGSKATTTATNNTLVGKALAVAANPSATGIVRLG